MSKYLDALDIGTIRKIIYDQDRWFDFVAERTEAGGNLKAQLIRSEKDSGWTDACRGEVAVELTNTGNGIKVRIGKKKIELDYDEAVNLGIALFEEQKLSPRTKRPVYRVFDEEKQ